VTNLRQTFQHAKLKVERGEHHIGEYVQTILAFLKTDFCKVAIERNGDTSNYSLKIDATAPYPPELPAIIGENAVHNLRTALDYIIVEFTGLNPDWIALPVAKGRSEVEALERYKAIREHLPDFADFILDEIQPYAGGKFKVWELAKLDNIDKHKLLIPITKFSTLLRMDIEDQNGNRISDTFVLVEEGQTLSICSGLREPKINYKGNAGITILFGQDTPFSNIPVLEVLGDLPKLTLHAIEALESFCFGEIADPHLR
jgi:hypothetical protein